jgi:hypothetical protein
MGVDMAPLDGVDLVFDFGLRQEEFQKQWRSGQYSTVCIFNVLEHTFDPLTVLTNGLSCVDTGGTLLVVTPSIWPIHNYPGDYNRLLPDWYVEFARRNNLKLAERHFCWLSQFGIETIDPTSDISFPTYMSREHSSNKLRYWISRVGHKALNTYGRSHWATHAAIGAAFLVSG